MIQLSDEDTWPGGDIGITTGRQQQMRLLLVIEPTCETLMTLTICIFFSNNAKCRFDSILVYEKRHAVSSISLKTREKTLVQEYKEKSGALYH